MTRTPLFVILAAVLLVPGCASAPPALPVPPSWDQKVSWILRLEDQRVLRAAGPAASAPRAALSPTVAGAPDLVTLASDGEARVRRRAALAIGRVGLADGIAPLTRLLADPDPEVRQMAAFGLGLIGDKAAVTPLAAALADSSPLVQGRAAEALGLLDARDQAAAIATMASVYVGGGALRGLAPDDLTHPMSPETEAVRLSFYALARLKAFDALATVALDGAGMPVTRWWPVAYALRHVDDARAVPALRALVEGEGQYSRAFAARGLGEQKSRDALPVLIGIAADVARQPVVGIEAIRALGGIKAAEAVAVLLRVARVPTLDASVRAEALVAAAACGGPADGDALLDLLSDRAPAVRGAAFRALAELDAERFLTALSGLDPDPDWSVRAAIATAAGTLPRDTAAHLLLPMMRDTDVRVRPAVYAALGAAKVSGADEPLVEALKSDDAIVRGAAATALGELKAASALEPLTSAWTAAAQDASYGARAAILGAVAAIDRGAALPLLTAALQDRDWAVRVRAAALLKSLDPSKATEAAIRPAPTTLPVSMYEDPAVRSPRYSTHVYFETDKGTIQVELAVLDAPLTVHTFVTLARKGYFDGLAFHRVVANFVIQDGDPRGDGEGGPGFTIRDELNQRPYLRGTLGMALDWKDTGGSQYFLTHSPQPHLDARYTVFGQVVDGMEVVDRIAPGDVVRRVRVWDGSQ